MTFLARWALLRHGMAVCAIPLRGQVSCPSVQPGIACQGWESRGAAAHSPSSSPGEAEGCLMYFIHLTGLPFLTPFLLDRLPSHSLYHLQNPHPLFPLWAQSPSPGCPQPSRPRSRGQVLGTSPCCTQQVPSIKGIAPGFVSFASVASPGFAPKSWLCLALLLGILNQQDGFTLPLQVAEMQKCPVKPSARKAAVCEGSACPPAWRNTHGQHRGSSPAPHLLKGGRKFCLQGAVTKSRPENPRPSAERNHCAAKNSTQCKHSAEKKIILS